MAAPCGAGPPPPRRARAPGPAPRVASRRTAAEAPEEAPGRRQEVTVRYDRGSCGNGCTGGVDPGGEIPELEIDVDELLDMESDGARSARCRYPGWGGGWPRNPGDPGTEEGPQNLRRGPQTPEILCDCYKPTEAFVGDLLEKIRGMQKLNTPQRRSPLQR
ncbi:protein phosphatase 1 regulatory subunit 14B-like [Strigops habroptila]|uniref:protein phosphatase 1 regulatory subunit 14B-like n=1 Tax=Strigops habroptila TaxID=2489341 RepID=UPI0011CF1173|nr:protein phosphatase 1 regulatory subunit 14B-like [Strigops habroptila]